MLMCKCSRVFVYFELYVAFNNTLNSNDINDVKLTENFIHYTFYTTELAKCFKFAKFV